MKRNKKDIIDIAIDILTGYCDKHTECKKCRFCDEDMNCILEDNIPADWNRATERLKS